MAVDVEGVVTMNQHGQVGDDPFADVEQTIAELEEEGFAEFLDLPDSPTWGGIVLFFALVLLFGATAWGNAAVQTGSIYGRFSYTIGAAAFAGGSFGIAATGWRWFNMHWHRLSYEERTAFCVVGILLTALSIAWSPLGWWK
jgi:hypothetical protein